MGTKEGVRLGQKEPPVQRPWGSTELRVSEDRQESQESDLQPLLSPTPGHRLQVSDIRWGRHPILASSCQLHRPLFPEPPNAEDCTQGATKGEF